MSEAPLRWVERSFPGRPAFDTAVSRALLHEVGEGRMGETLRVYEPDDVLAFSVLDRTRAGFARAVAAARAEGFAPTLRLAGGRAAVFHRETLAFSWCIPSAEPRRDIPGRFAALAAIVSEALAALGVDARIGEVPGEYCPGEYSVNARGRRKLMGVGQRIVRGAAHVGGVIVVGDAGRIRDVLAPVYRELDYPFDPGSVGAVSEEVGPLAKAQVAEALRAAFARRRALLPGAISDATLHRAGAFEADHAIED